MRQWNRNGRCSRWSSDSIRFPARFLRSINRSVAKRKEREREGEKVETETEEVERIKLMTDVRVLTRVKKKRRRLIASFCKDVCSRNYLSVRLICCLSFFYRVQGKKIVSYCCVFLDVFRGWYLQNYFLKCYYVFLKKEFLKEA